MMSVINQGSTPIERMKLEDMLDIIRNESTYSKRIDELKKYIDEANQATVNLTKAKDLDAELKAANQANAVAQALLKEARDKSARMEIEAEAKAASIIDEANQYKDNLNRELSSKHIELNDVTVNITLANQHLQVARDELTKAQSAQAELNQKRTALMNEIEDKRKALKALLA